MDVTVRLDELVLDGVDAADPLVARALERAIADALPAGAGVAAATVAAATAHAVRREASDG
jgi:hypothetical protein